MRKLLALLACVTIALGGVAVSAQGPSNASYVAEENIAENYAYGFGNNPGGNIIQGNSSTGTATVEVCPAQRALSDGRVINMFATNAPIYFDYGTATQDTVTPTSVSLVSPPIGQQGDQLCAMITGSFTYTHGNSQNYNQVRSGTFGLQEAINAAAGFNGTSSIAVNGQGHGGVTIGPSWGGTSAMIYAATAFPRVAIIDKRDGAPRYWNVRQQGTTALATPAVLTAQAACDATHIFCSDATVAGSASWGSTVYGCIAYVDIMGNMSPACSTTASFTSVASKAIDIWLGTGPAASAGAVGWVPFLSLSGGTYQLTYSTGLLTQPTALQAGPVSAGYCTLTTLETVTPACSLKNTTYNQTGSGYQYTGYPVATNQLSPNLNSASSVTYNPQPGGVTLYGYTPGSGVGIPELPTPYVPFPITTAAQSTIAQIAGTIQLPPNFMNYVGRGIRVCGQLYKTSTTADTISNVQLWWDAEGSNTTGGVPIELSNIQITATLTAAPTYQFCQDVYTSVAAATATGGTLQPGMGWMTESQVSAGTIHFAGPNILFAAVGSLNLALPAQLQVVYNHTTGTDGTGVILLDATVTPIS